MAKQESYDIIFSGIDNVTPETKAIIASFEAMEKKIAASSLRMTELDRELNKLSKQKNVPSDLSKNFLEFNSSLSSSTRVIGDLATSTVKATAALTAMVAGGVVYAIKEFAAYEDVMLKVKGILGLNADEYERLSKLTKELGTTTRFTAKEAAEGLQSLAMAGLDAQKAYDALPGTLQLAQAAALDLGKTADIVTNIMTGYGFEAADLTRINDGLTATFTSANTDLEGLGQSFKFVGPVAKSLGLSFEETSAALGVLANAGYSAEMGGTALRNILLALVAPTTNMNLLLEKLGVTQEEFGVDISSSRNAMASLGVAIKDANGEMRPFGDILQDLKGSLDAIPSSADRSATAVNIFGKRGGPQLLAMLEQGGDSVNLFKQRIEEAGGVTIKIADEMESGMGGALRSLNSAFSGFFIEVGAQINKFPIDSLKEVFLAAAKEVEKGTFDPILRIINELGGDIGKALQGIAKNFPEAFKNVDISGLERAVKDITQSLRGLFGIDDLMDADGLARAIQKVVDTIESMISITDGVVVSFKPLLATIDALVTAFNDLSPGTKELIGVLGGAAAQIASVTAAIGAAGLVIPGLATGFTTITTAMSGVVAGAAGLTAGLAGIAGVVGVAAGSVIRLIPGVDELAQKLIGIAIDGENAKFEIGEDVESVQIKANAMLKYRRNLALLAEQQKENAAATEEATEAVEDFSAEIRKTAAEIEGGFKFAPSVDFEAVDETTRFIKDEFGRLAIKTDIDVGLKEESLAKADKQLKDFIEYIDEETGARVFEFVGEVNQDSIRDVEEIKDKLSEDRKFVLEIETKKAEEETKRIVSQIETSGAVMQKALELNAQVKIAQAERDLKALEAMLDSTSSVVAELGKSTADMFAAYSKDMDFTMMNLLRDSIRQQMEIQREQADLQREIIELEIEKRKLQNDVLKDPSKAMLSVEISPDVEPALQLVMRYILQNTRIWGTEYGFEQLLEVPV